MGITMTTDLCPIPGHDGYAADSGGNVWSVGANWRGYGARMLAAHADRNGYLKVRLVLDGKRRKRTVHTLVALAFIGPKPSKAHEVCHINGLRTDNRADNLRWGTRKDNAADRERHGRTSRGADHSRAIKRGLALTARRIGRTRRVAKAEGRDS